MQAFDARRVPLIGPHLVEAGAGTGKTYAIATLYLRLILERDLAVNQILVVTFTEAATAELKDRLRARLRDGLDTLRTLAEGQPAADAELAALLTAQSPDEAQRRLQAALHGFDEAAVFTIHAFCMRMLKDGAFESGLPFDVKLISSQKTLLDRIAGDFWVRERYDRYPFEVAHLDSRLGYTGVRRLTEAAAENPDIALLPERDSGRSMKAAMNLHQALYVRLREMWLDSGAEVRDLLERAVADKVLKNYRPDWLAGWLAHLAVFFEPDTLRAPELPERFEKFCTPSMPANKGKQPPAHVFFDLCETFRHSHEALVDSLDELVEQTRLQLVAEVRRKLPSYKEEGNQLYFQDLLHYLDRALHGEGGDLLAWTIGHRFPAAMIDEFQDTDEMQYRIFRRLFLHPARTLFLIGDPKQAIYGFRGADIHTYLRAAADSAGNRCTMHTNWRSDPGLIAALNRLFGGHANPFLIPDIGFPEVAARPGARDVFQVSGRTPAPFCITHVPPPADGDGKPMTREQADKCLPELLAVRVSRLLDAGAEIDGRPLEPGDIAVLVRTNKQGQAVRHALNRYRIPCVLQGHTSVYQTDDAYELELVLRAVAEPTRSHKVKPALCTRILGARANDLLAMEENPELWEARVRKFRRWRDIWQNQGFIQMFRALIAEADVQRRLFAGSDGERAMTNLLHLAELLQEAAVREHLGPSGLPGWLEKQRDADAAEETAAELRLESDARAVAVVTIHRSKGLEYPVVFCPYLWEGVGTPRTDVCIYHDPARGSRVLDLRREVGADVKQRLADAESAERLRLAYVALTRARHYVEVMWGCFGGCGKSPLGYLLFGRDGDTDGLKDLHKDEAAMLNRLEAQVRAAGPVWSLEVLDDQLRGVPFRPRDNPPELVLRRYRRKLGVARRNTSFSQLTAADHQPALLPVKDHDAFVPPVDAAGLAAARAAETVPLNSFPRGARAGIFFHSVLEHSDFTWTDPARQERTVTLELRKAGFDIRLADTLCAPLQRILDTPLLPDGAPRLNQIPLSERLDELAFLFPIAHEARDGDGLLSPTSLADAFRAHGDHLPPGYPERLAELGFSPLRGYMKGYVDLIFRYKNRWYLVDYKSNYLGATFADYAAAKLPTAMAESHYYLQYHIYTLALHRYLERRLPGYAYDTHFGGVLYLFLKGMDPDLGCDYGVFYDMPPRALIEALSHLVGTADREVEV